VALDATPEENAASPSPAGPAPALPPPARRMPATVVTWNCGSLMRQMQPIEHLIRSKRPDVIFHTETFLLRKHHRYLSKALAQGYVAHYSSLDTKGRGRPRGGVAVLVSSKWAHASAIRPWAGTPIPGYLDGLEVCTTDGLSHTLLAAYVPPGADNEDLAVRVRDALYDASVAHVDRLVVDGEFNGVMPGERIPPRPATELTLNS